MGFHLGEIRNNELITLANIKLGPHTKAPCLSGQRTRLCRTIVKNSNNSFLMLVFLNPVFYVNFLPGMTNTRK